MRGRLVAGVAVAALALPGQAHAAPAVVLTAPDGARLALEDAPKAADLATLAPVSVDRTGSASPSAFCVQTLQPGQRPGRGCEQSPLPTLDDPVRVFESGTSLGGVVPEGVATVELVLGGGPPMRVATQPGDYRGAFAGRVRFFLAAIPETASVAAIRALDADGAPIGGEGLENDQRLTKSVIVGRGRLAGGDRWASLADTSAVAQPAAGAPERREERACLSVTLTSRKRSSLRVTGCRDPRRAAAGLLVSLPDCDTHRTALAALLPPGVRRASVTLGDGRRLKMPTRVLSPTERAAAVAVPKGAAVRDIRAGGRVRTLGLAPATTGCGFDELTGRRLSGSGIPGAFRPAASDLFPPPAAPVEGAQAVAAAGGVSLFVATRGDDVCAGLGRPPRSPDGCAPAPLRARQSRFAGRGRAVAVITAPAVGSVQLLVDGDVVASAPTVAAGAGRAAVLQAPRRRLLVARLIGADGHPLADVGLAPVIRARARTVARGRSWVATATPIFTPVALPEGVFPAALTCVQVSRRTPREVSEDCLDDARGRVRVVATCAPRLVHVIGVGRGATLVLADGRRRAATSRRGVFHALLRRHEALRRVILGRSSVRLRVPPAARQCGYRAEAIVTG